MLALLLAETIQRDSWGLVIDVCRYQLGGHGPWPEEEPLSSPDLSTSCSEEVCCSLQGSTQSLSCAANAMQASCTVMWDLHCILHTISPGSGRSNDSGIGWDSPWIYQVEGRNSDM